ncbi:FISUMP domain-containing protein [Elizabethkingia anophelis]|uniref:FISUMP domain-containing protein n=1 Tax=Elizabethkingia anophelis TaxID=1117645 RepID=UPI00136A69A8|nr:FISUMP domain-containing protein [Elizabethkingia anophelis]MYY27277.1 hypothetical protein [Elizabethkingia anophelis]
MYKKIKTQYAFLLLFILFASCRNSDVNNNLIVGSKTNGIKINLINSEFGKDVRMATQTSRSVDNISNLTDNNIFSRREYNIDNFSIVTQLSSDISSHATSKASVNHLTSNFLGTGSIIPMKYRIAIYKSDGTYLGQDVGDTSMSGQVFFENLNLSAGEQYTFVTYSVGSTQDPPAIPTINLNNSELNLLGLDGTESGSDFMYAINEGVNITGGGNTILNVQLKHMFSKITVVIDDSDAVGTFGQSDYVKGGYALSSNLNGGITGLVRNYTASKVRLKDGFITGTTLGDLDLAGITTNSKSFIINTGGESAFRSSIVFPTNTIVIGKDKNVNSVIIDITGNTPTITGTGLQPGKSYTLKIKFNSDRYANSDGLTNMQTGTYVVIGGYRWDRYNLGATRDIINNNPDQNPSKLQLFGNQYQWGKSTVVANASTNNNAIAGWNQINAPDNAWNTGDQSNPIKTSTDPCANGYRVPLMSEFKSLISSTIPRHIGTMQELPTNYTYAAVYTSKKSKNIMLTLPAAGFRKFDNGMLQGRGTVGYYWSSSVYDTNNNSYYLYDDSQSNLTSAYSKLAGLSIRCIAQ